MEEKRIKVLLVEDNPGDARLMQETLADVKGIAFDIEWVDLLSRGLERSQNNDIDVILLDLTLPDSQGIDSFFRLQRQSSGIPILVLTGLYDEKLAVKAVHEGAQDYLIKGQVDGNVLVRSIRYAIERQRIEEELRKSNNFSQSILKALPFGMDIVDYSGDILYMSEKFQDIFGKDAIGKKCWLVYKDDKTQCLECCLKEGIEIGEVKSSETESTIGGKIFQIMHIGIIYQGKRAVLEIFNDITERKHIEQMKSDFVALVSHQLKTPVGEMKGYIDNMLNGLTGQLSEKQKQYLNEMKSISARAYRLISDLLNISRIERGIVAVNLNPVGLHEIVELSTKDFQEQIQRKGLTLKLEGINNRIMVRADKDKIVESVNNVINNAIKFTEKGGIVIGIKKDNGFGFIEIRDTGKGIPDDLLAKLFKKEYTLSGTASTETGTGLGLYIAKNFMLLQNGDVWVESALNSGSKFIFKIPLDVV